MSKENDALGDLPEASVDDVERAPGGADATPAESDVGGGAEPVEDMVTPDQPLSAQQDEEQVPDEIQQPESSDDSKQDAASKDAESKGGDSSERSGSAEDTTDEDHEGHDGHQPSEPPA